MNIVASWDWSNFDYWGHIWTYAAGVLMSRIAVMIMVTAV